MKKKKIGNVALRKLFQGALEYMGVGEQAGMAFQEGCKEVPH